MRLVSMKLIVGLGNPGKDYDKTRHNIGWELLQAFAEHHRADGFKKNRALKAEITDIRIGSERVFLAFPTTFMNLSGQAVQAIASFYKIPVDNILILQDEMDVEVGKAKFTAKGGAAGHNGITSIQQSLATNEIARFRIGVNRPTGQIKVEDYVLQRFSPEDEQQLNKRANTFIEALDSWVNEGLTKAMSSWNGVLGAN